MVGLRHPSFARQSLILLRRRLDARLSRIPRRSSMYLTGAHPRAPCANPTCDHPPRCFSGFSISFGASMPTSLYYAPLLVLIVTRPFRLLFPFQPSPQHRLSYT